MHHAAKRRQLDRVQHVSPGRRRFRARVSAALATISCSIAPAFAADAMLKPLATSVPIDQPVLFDVVFLDEAAAATVDVRIDWNGTTFAGRLVRIDEDASDSSRRRYRLESDVSIGAGDVLVTLENGSAARLSVVRNDPPADEEQPPARETIRDLLFKPEQEFHTTSSLTEFLADRLKAHEPMYFLYGPDDPAGKFQLSFKYQLFSDNGSLARSLPAVSGLFIGYSQTSFWDLRGESKPFFDNSYRPEILFSYEQVDRFLKREGERLLPDWVRLDFAGGFQHESNGRDGFDSRSLNTVYIRPAITFGDRESYFVSVGSRIYSYVGDLGDNPDIANYRGHVDLRVVAGHGGGLQLATTARLGDGGDRGSLQFDLSYPLRNLLDDNLDIYLHGQVFTGFGESLLEYDKHDTVWRAGISIVR